MPGWGSPLLTDELRALLQGQFPNTDEESKLALRYAYETERFDRSVCHARCARTGDAMPFWDEERRRCTMFAKKLDLELRTQIRERGLDPKAYSSERKHWSYMSYEKLAEIYERTFLK